MNLSCPHCGKGLSISHDELMVCRGVVICPQCLTEFVAEGVELPEPEPESPVAPGPALPEVQTHGGERYCYGCGKELPHHEGLRFCPFCGVALLSNQQAAASTSPVQVAAVQRQSVSEPQAAKSETKSKSSSSSQSPNAYRYVPKVFSKELRPEPPSLRFKIIAYFIVVVLVAIFGVIVYLGNRL